MFEIDRAPFVVRNPEHGKPKGGPIAYEVPWREGTSTRTAARADLLRVLQPATLAPWAEAVDGSLSVKEIVKVPGLVLVSLNLRLYVIPRSESPVALPSHRCAGTVTASDAIRDCELGRWSISASPGELGIDAVLREPTYLHLGSSVQTQGNLDGLNDRALVHVALNTAPGDRVLALDLAFSEAQRPDRESGRNWASYQLEERRSDVSDVLSDIQARSATRRIMAALRTK